MELSLYQIYLCITLLSPTVPPNSITHTSAGPSFPSTGMTATDSIQFLMASVMCGTTWNLIKAQFANNLQMQCQVINISITS